MPKAGQGKVGHFPYPATLRQEKFRYIPFYSDYISLFSMIFNLFNVYGEFDAFII